jgi:hypothetical protein
LILPLADDRVNIDLQLPGDFLPFILADVLILNGTFFLKKYNYNITVPIKNII